MIRVIRVIRMIMMIRMIRRIRIIRISKTNTKTLLLSAPPPSRTQGYDNQDLNYVKEQKSISQIQNQYKYSMTCMYTWIVYLQICGIWSEIAHFSCGKKWHYHIKLLSLA